jgi:hypothetical protein
MRSVYRSEGKCWLWNGCTNPAGYGVINIKENGVWRTRLAHRVAWELFCGSVPKGLLVCHKCDTPACVNPAHHFLGTDQDNVADRVRKGRTAQGVNHYQAKLTEAAVIAIRSLRGDFNQYKLAQRFGVSQHVISAIQLRQTWKAL